MGVGRLRIAFSGKWGIVGEKKPDWSYQAVLEDPATKGVYLSPQQLHSLKQGKSYPKHNSKKSDVFALGFMIMEIIFQQNFSELFDYEKYEIKLTPLVEKLKTVKDKLN